MSNQRQSGNIDRQRQYILSGHLIQMGMPHIFKAIAHRIGQDNIAYLFWVIASIMWNLGFIFPAEHRIGVIPTNLSRGLALILVNTLGLYSRQMLTKDTELAKELSRTQVIYVTLRHILLTMYAFGFTESTFYLPSPVLYTIYFSGPLFVMILQYFFYNIVLTDRQLKGVVLSVIGVLLTSNGQMIWAWVTGNHQFDTDFKNYKTDSFVVKSLVALGMVVLTFGWACSIIVVRKVQKHVHWTLNFNYGLVLTFTSGMAYCLFGDSSVVENPTLFLQLFLKQGMVIAVGQIFFMCALLLTKKSGQVCMIGFVSVIFSYFLSTARYHESLNYLCVVGSLIALSGIYFTVIKE